jgi:hypothetical protein
MRSCIKAAVVACAAALAGCSSASSNHMFSAQAVAGALNAALPSPPTGPELEVAIVYHVSCSPARAAAFNCTAVRDTSTPTSTTRGDLRLSYQVTVDDRGCWTARLRHSSESVAGSDYTKPPHGCGLRPA